jgi:hypothetical protein
VTALRAFPAEAKADIAAFVAEHGLAGTVRATILGASSYLHRSGDAEAGAVRQPNALQAHLAKLPHGFLGAPVGVVCDAKTGAALDPVRAAPWLLAAVDADLIASAKDRLGALGLAPADVTLAAPVHLGVVAASLAEGEIALVVIPAETQASLVWVGSDGVHAVASAEVGYAKIFEAVQHGLGLKFRAAAAKLFYNENYDFADAAAKIAAEYAEAIKPELSGKPAALVHIAGLTPGQSWLADGLATALGLKPWKSGGGALLSRLGLEAGAVSLPTSASGLLAIAATGPGEAPWVQPTLEALAARPAGRPLVESVDAVEPAPAPAKAGAPGAKPGARPVAPAPATKSAPKLVARPTPPPQPLLSVAVEDTQSLESAEQSPRRGKKGPVFVAGILVAVAAVAGLAMTMRGQKNRPAVASQQSGASTAPAGSTTQTPPAAPPETAPARVPTTAPAIAPVPVPVPIVVTPANAAANVSPAADRFAADPRRFGNDRYRLEITDKGFVQGLATSRDEVLVEAAAGVSLQGSYVGTDGRRKWFNVGGVDDAGYQATVRKSVRDGTVVFDVKVTHPRFEIEQSFRCLPDKVKVSANFKPINLRDPRGAIAAVHSVRLSPVALNPSLRMRPGSDSFAYSMKAGSLNVVFDNSTWARDGADGKQTIIAGENGVAFHFTENPAGSTALVYEIAMP